MSKPKLLLQACCAPCSGFLVKKLAIDFAVTVYFSNNNLYPAAEYQKRLNEAQDYFQREKVDFMVAPYNHQTWQEAVAGWENEPERGKRCALCYAYRLTQTAKIAKENDFVYFASTLAISPHKDAQLINQLGQEIGQKQGIKFLIGDWKKEDGFKKAMVLSRAERFYQQDYCGCEFSLKR